MRFTPAEFLDHLLALPKLGGEAVSPDLKYVAWTWYGRGPVADVYVAPTDGLLPPTRLTDTLQDTSVVSWSADSRTLIVSEDKDGDERERLYAIDIFKPLQMTLLTDADPHYFLRGGKLAPDGRTLVYAANRDPDTGAEIEPYLVYAQDIASGERRVIARPKKPGTGAPQLNEHGTHILYTRKDLHPAGQQVWLVNMDGSGDREVFNAGDDQKVRVTWMRDSKRAIVVAETKTHKKLGLWERDSGNTRWLIDDPKRNLEYAYAPRGIDSIVAVEIDAARTKASLIDADLGVGTEVGSSPGVFLPLAWTGDEWVGTTYSAQQPRDLVRIDRNVESFTLTRLWDITPLRPADFVAAEDVRWKARDRLEIQGWLYRTRLPSRGLVLHVHGGPTAHSEDRVSAMVQFLVSQGFDVLEPNYRGSTGFGLPFRESIKQTFWGGAEQDDIRAGIEHLIAQGIARAGKVGITGTSYGGYSSWCAITRWPREIIAAAAPICGMTDLVVDYETTRPDLRPYSEEMLGGPPSRMPERYRERSPIHFVGNIKGELLIVQGARDPNVTPENVRAVRAALDAAKIKYDTLVFDDEGHGISKPANQKRLFLALAEFFGRAFGPG
jgi:dipeptidyl aminopeptidase/acylaminoacyl peptidase